MPRKKFFSLQRIFDFYFVRQIQALTAWLALHGRESESVFIDLPWQERYIHSGPLAFIFCTSGGLTTALEKNNRKDSENWKRLFGSTTYEIWEYVGDYKELPLRFGLTDEEKEFALIYVRQTIEQFLKTGDSSSVMATMPERFSERANVGVTLWVHGSSRGCRALLGKPLCVALSEVAIRACRDERYKPLSLEELAQATIEITILSDLGMPLSQKEIEENIIDPTKTYMLSVGGRNGHFVPPVFNMIRVEGGLQNFLIQLIEKKARVSRDFLPMARIVLLETNSFIGVGQSHMALRSLRGPVLKRSVIAEDAMHAIERIARATADFLCCVQEPDGNIPTILDPLKGTDTSIDWVRFSLAAGTLARAGKVYDVPQYLDTARRAFSYLQHNFFSHPFVKDYTRCLGNVYAYRLACELGEEAIAEQLHQDIVRIFPNIPYEPIYYSQVALHFFAYKGKDASLLKQAEANTLAILHDYEERIRNRSFLDLSRFPELISLLKSLGDMRGDSHLLERSAEISQWYVSQQAPDGSFPGTYGKNFSYVRGTGKIFEVLCLEPEKNRKCIERVAAYLSEMQYDAENTFFLKEDMRQKVAGGFRHDFLNQAVWSDASAHVLIGATRLKEWEKGITPS